MLQCQIGFQVQHANEHSPAGIIREILETPSGVESSDLVVEPMREDTDAADVFGGANRGLEGKQEKRCRVPLLLVPPVDGKLTEERCRYGIGTVSLLRFRQSCPLDLCSTQRHERDDPTRRSIRKDVDPR